MNPTEAEAAAGAQVRFTFAVIQRDAVAYSVESADAAISSWCRVLLPAVRASPGELVVDVPADAGPGGYRLRLVATAGGREIAAGDVTLRVEGERCLRILPSPKFSVEADGTVLFTLRVVNCGIVDANLLLRAHHEDGWSFSVDSPELIIGVGKGPVTVQVILRPPIGRRVDRGDGVTVEVETGTGWRPLSGRVQRPAWPWVAAAAVALVVTVAVAGGAWAWWPESDDDGAVATELDDGPADSGADTGLPRDSTTGPDNGSVDGGADAGLPGDIDVEASKVDFGRVAVGHVADQTVVFRNTGDQSAEVTVDVDGDDEIAAGSGCDVVPGGGECELLISFTPEEVGLSEASVTVGDEAIEVTGEGLADEPDPEIQSLTVDVFGCNITVEWDAAGDPNGRLELIRDGQLVDDSLTVESGSVEESAFDLFGEGGHELTYELVAYDSDGDETDRASASDADSCVG
jgi:Abnormal spindle-like microcephaly-assoc'd, ASPM-SPD-2-Hydin